MLAALTMQNLQLWQGSLNTHGPRVRIPFRALAFFHFLLWQRCCDGPAFQQRSHTACVIRKPSLETSQSCHIDSVQAGLAIWGTRGLFGACFGLKLATGSTAWFLFHVGIGLFLSVHSYIQKGRGIHRSRTQWGPVSSSLGQRRTEPEADHYVNIMPVARGILTVKRSIRFAFLHRHCSSNASLVVRLLG